MRTSGIVLNYSNNDNLLGPIFPKYSVVFLFLRCNPNNLSESSSISKPTSTKDDSAVSDEVWDEFNAMLEADEAANNAAPSTTTTTNDEKLLDSTTSKEEDDDTTNLNMKPPTTHNEVDSNNIQKKTKKDDLYDNDDISNMEQTSYEARLARLILLKNKTKKQQKQRGLNSNEFVEPTAIKLPSVGDFYDPSLAWAEEDDDEQEDGQVVVVEKQGGSGINNQNKEDGMTSSKQQTTTTNLPTASALSMTKILRGRRDEARMLASRGEDDANNNEGASDGKWF